MEEKKKHFTIAKTLEIGKQLGIEWDCFGPEQFQSGLNVELEHGLENEHTNVTNDDALMTGKIALAHLNEFPDYYDRLEKMEEEAKDYWKMKRMSDKATELGF